MLPLLQTLVGVTTLLVTALLVYYVMRLLGRSTPQRHAVLLAALAGTLILPMVTPLVPYRTKVGCLPPGGNVRYSAPEAGENSPIATDFFTGDGRLSPTLPPGGGQPTFENIRYSAPEIGDDSPFVADSFPVPMLPPGGGQPTFDRQPVFTLIGFFVCVWSLGTIYFLLRFIRSWMTVQKILGKTMPVSDSLFDPLLKHYGITFCVKLRRSEAGVVPFTQGVLRPVVVLPLAADRWTTEQRRAVLTHELAHVKRRDVLWQMLAELCRCAYWFHPLVWFAARQLRIEREIACDDLVVLAGEEPSLYAALLTKIAAGMKNVPKRSAVLGCTVAMARRHEIKNRVAAIMNPNRLRKPLGRLGLGIVLLCACLGITLAAMLTPAEEKTQNEDVVPQEAGSVTPETVSNVVDLSKIAGPSREVDEPIGGWDESVKIKVIDTEGNPISAARVQPTHWLKKTGGGFTNPKLGLPSYTDENGEFTCYYSKRTTEHISYQIEKPGYRTHSGSIHLPHLSDISGHTVTVVLKNAFIVHGTVIDADSREPIRDFTVNSSDRSSFDSGFLPDVRWTSETGQYMASFANDSWNYSVTIRAPGYVPQSKSISEQRIISWVNTAGQRVHVLQSKDTAGKESAFDFELKKSVWGSAKDPNKPMVLLKIVDENDQPIPHAAGTLILHPRGHSIWERRTITEVVRVSMFTSNANGEVGILLPKQDDIYNFRIQVDTPGYTPYDGLFDERNLTAEIVIKVPATRTIGGVVKDSQGNPIAGVTVELAIPYTLWRWTTAYPEDIAAKTRFLKATTDAEGRWTLDGIPVDQIEYEKYPTPDEYVPAFGVMGRVNRPHDIENIQPRRLFLTHPKYRMTPVEVDLKKLLSDAGKFKYAFTMEARR